MATKTINPSCSSSNIKLWTKNIWGVKIFLFQDGSSWSHVSEQNVTLQSSTLLHLLEIERVYLQKQAQVESRLRWETLSSFNFSFQSCLANAELGTIIRIPKGEFYVININVSIKIFFITFNHILISLKMYKRNTSLHTYNNII